MPSNAFVQPLPETLTPVYHIKTETELSSRNSWTFSNQSSSRHKSTDLQAQKRTQWCFELILVYYWTLIWKRLYILTKKNDKWGISCLWKQFAASEIERWQFSTQFRTICQFARSASLESCTSLEGFLRFLEFQSFCQLLSISKCDNIDS